MIGMTKQLVGIEEDDIPYHLSLLNFTNVVDDILFYPVNDVHGRHSLQWIKNTQAASINFRKVVFYDLVNHGDDSHELFLDKIQTFDHHNKIHLIMF